MFYEPFARILGAGAIAFCALAPAVRADTVVRYATDGYGMGALAIIAAEKGYLKSEGIDAVIQTYSYGVDTVDAVLAGNADFGVIIDFPLLTRFSAGILISPAIIAEPLPGWHKLYTLANIDVPSGLAGKKFGVATGTAQEFVTRTYLTQNGIDPNTGVELVGFSSLFDIVGAMKAGRIDAAWIWGDGVETMNADTAWKYVVDDGVVNQSTSALLVSTKAYVAAEEGIVVKTLRAFQKASDFLNADPKAAADLLAAKTGADAARIQKVIEQQRYGISFGTGPVASLKAKYDFLVAAGKIEPYDFAAQFDSNALAEALPQAEIDPMLK